MAESDLVSLSLLRRAPHQSLHRLSLEPPGIYCLSRRHPAAFIVTARDLVTQVLKGAEGAIVKSALPENVRPILGDGTAASWFPPERMALDTISTGIDYLREQRGNALSKFLHATETDSRGIIARLVTELTHNHKTDEPMDAYAFMHEQMFRIAMECLFKVTVTDELLVANRVIHKSAPILHHHLRSSVGGYAPYFDRVYTPRFELWRWLPGSQLNTLRARRRAINAVTDQLINYAASSDYQSRFSLIGLLLASYENSATACAWAIWHLAIHPEWQDRVSEEINTKELALGSPSMLRAHRPLLSATLNETLRLFPPVWSMGRMVQKAVRLDNHDLAAGSAIIISPWLQHRHPAFWEHSQCFQPERFLSNPTINGTFLPFGVEPHTCPGERFSWITIAAVLAELLKYWRFAPVANNTPQPMLGLTQRPENGIMIRLTPRR